MPLRKLGELNAIQRLNLESMAKRDLAAGKSIAMIAARLNVEEQAVTEVLSR